MPENKNHTFNSKLILWTCIPKFRWVTNTSAVLPSSEGDEQVLYTVGVLRSANPASCAAQCLDDILSRNRRLVEASSAQKIGAKQYLAHHPSLFHWRGHFGGSWNRFVARKNLFDPLAILAPGQGIFPRIHASTL